MDVCDCVSVWLLRLANKNRLAKWPTAPPPQSRQNAKVELGQQAKRSGAVDSDFSSGQKLC